MSTRIQYIKRVVITLLAAVIAFSCQSDLADDLKPDLSHKYGNPGERTANDESRTVLLLYSAGFNTLSSYLKEDINDLKSGWLPEGRRTEDVVLIYSHFPKPGGSYSIPSSPTLVRIYNDLNGTAVTDTLVVYPEGTISSSADQLNNVLTFVKDQYPAKGYGMIFSSHATGYLPAGYYQNPTDFDKLEWPSARGRRMTSVPYIEPEYDPSMPMVKSIGQDQVGTYGSYVSYELELADFAEAIPMELDFLLFDACLMGGIEVAYELKEKVRMLGFSQTEVLAEGYCYPTIASRLLEGDEPDLKGVCQDFYHQYEVQSGIERSATVSLIDCSRLQPMKEVCKVLFEKYSDQISTINPKNVQKFYRSDRHWFYDLESILINAGASDDELAELHMALDECVAYKAHTPRFMNDFAIHPFSGFSMYLPSDGSKYLDEFYKTLKWNQDTGLVN